jgi:hypothetical protein
VPSLVESLGCGISRCNGHEREVCEVSRNEDSDTSELSMSEHNTMDLEPGRVVYSLLYCTSSFTLHNVHKSLPALSPLALEPHCVAVAVTFPGELQIKPTLLEALQSSLPSSLLRQTAAGTPDQFNAPTSTLCMCPYS